MYRVIMGDQDWMRVRAFHNQVTHSWCRVFLEWIIVAQLVKKFTLVWTLTVRYSVHKSLPLGIVLS
jgi:hypothetical protein